MENKTARFTVLLDLRKRGVVPVGGDLGTPGEPNPGCAADASVP